MENFRPHKLGKDGLHSICKTCQKVYSKGYYRRPKVKKQRKQWREKRKKTHPKLWAKQKLKHLLKMEYGLSLEQYDEIFEQQNGVCAICGGINSDGRRLFVDHNHKTNKVRGLLCINCNRKLGIVEDTGFVCAANLYLKATDS